MCPWDKGETGQTRQDYIWAWMWSGGRLECGGLWKKGWRLWTSPSEWVGATGSYRAGVTWASWCFGERIASPLSFSLAVELTCSCKRLGHVPCPRGTHLQEGHFFHYVSSHSVRKHPPGAWVYSFKVQNASYCKARGKNLFFSFSLLPTPPPTLVFCLSLWGSWRHSTLDFSYSHNEFSKSFTAPRREPQPRLEVERPIAFQSFSPFLQGDGMCVR